MTLCEKISLGRFIITSEIGPPKGIHLDEVLTAAEALAKRVDAINVTDLQNAVMRVGSLAVSRLLVERSIEPIFQLTCRDRNRLALQSELLSASALGIENVLLLTGDYPTFGDHPEAKPVFDLGSVELIDAARGLQEGKDMNGNALKGAPHFCIGAVVNPGADPLEPEVMKMDQKVKAGAQFFQTQAVFDIEQFKLFLEETKRQGVKAAIIAGIVLLKSGAMARYMNKNVAGVNVPESLIKEMEEATDKKAKSVEIGARLIRSLKPLCQGIHLMPIGWDAQVPLVLDAAGI